MKYNLFTHSSYSHTFLTQRLDALGAQYRFLLTEDEESYSRFEVVSSPEVFETMKNLIEENNGTAITIQYGTY